jgi:hypothetical protein
VAASGLRLGGEQKRMRTSSHLAGPGHVSTPDPCLGPVQGPCTFRPRTLGPHCGDLDPIRRGLDPIPEDQLAHVEVRDQPWGSGLYIRGSETNPGGSELYIRESGALPWGSGQLLMP